MMKLPTIKQLVSDDAGGYVTFQYFSDNALWYRVYYVNEIHERLEFIFPVPVEDAKGGTFHAQEASRVYFMRWMRKHLEYLKSAQAEGENS